MKRSGVDVWLILWVLLCLSVVDVAGAVHVLAAARFKKWGSK